MGQAEEPASAVRVERYGTLFLSGGGFRAGIASVGVIAHLIHTGRWHEIKSVVSVSGGSLANASLAASEAGLHTDSIEVDAIQTAEALRHFLNRVIDDPGLPWKSWRRAGLAARFVIGLAMLVAIIPISLGAFGPMWMQNRPLAFLVGISLVPLFIQNVRLTWGAYLRDVSERLSHSRGKQLATIVGTGEDGHQPRSHVFCATGLFSAVPYYFTSGGPVALAGRESAPGGWHTRSREWAQVISTGYTIGDAVFASSSLPLAGGLKAPKSMRREILIDGGTSGNFGQQFVDVARPHDRHKTRNAFVYMDAGQYLGYTAKTLRMANRFSVISLLGRWIRVYGEATYRNDLLDIQDPDVAVQILRVSESGQTYWTVDEDGEKSRDWCLHERTAVQRRLDELRRRSRSVGYLGFGVDQAGLLLAVSILAAADALPHDGKPLRLDEVEPYLRDVCTTTLDLDPELADATVAAWVSTRQRNFFELDERAGPFAISHEGVTNDQNPGGSRGAYYTAIDDGFEVFQVDVVAGRHELVSKHTLLGRSRKIRSLHRDELAEHANVWPTLHSLVADPYLRVPMPIDRLAETVAPHPSDPLAVQPGDIETQTMPARWNIEFKSAQVYEQLRAFLREMQGDPADPATDLLDHFAVSAPYHRRLLRKLRAEFPSLATNAALTEGAGLGMALLPPPIRVQKPWGTSRTSGNRVWRSPLRFVREGRASGVQLHRRVARNRDVVNRQNGKARAVQVWVVDQPEQALDMVRNGATAIITDQSRVNEQLRSVEFIKHCPADIPSADVVRNGPARSQVPAQREFHEGATRIDLSTERAGYLLCIPPDEAAKVVEYGLDPRADADFTVLAWVRRPEPETRSYIADTRRLTEAEPTDAAGWYFGFYDTRLHFHVSTGAWASEGKANDYLVDYDMLSDGVPVVPGLADGAWHLVGVVVDREHGISFIVDDRMSSQQSLPADGRFDHQDITSTVVRVGAAQEPNSQFAPGEIAAAWVVEEALGAEDLREVYASTVGLRGRDPFLSQDYYAGLVDVASDL